MLAQENLGAAGELLRSGRFRSSVSRAYYAAFSAAALELEAVRTTFPRDWDGPAHASVPKLIERRLTHLPASRRHDAKRSMRLLYNARLGADYMPWQHFERKDASEALKHATLVFRRLEVKL